MSQAGGKRTIELRSSLYRYGRSPVRQLVTETSSERLSGCVDDVRTGVTSWNAYRRCGLAAAQGLDARCSEPWPKRAL